MDTLDLMLSTLAALFLIVLALSALSARLYYALRHARQDAQSRPRSPQKHAAGYDTGLIER